MEMGVKIGINAVYLFVNTFSYPHTSLAMPNVIWGNPVEGMSERAEFRNMAHHIIWGNTLEPGHHTS